MTGFRTLKQRIGTNANGMSDSRVEQVSQRSNSGFTFIEVLVSLMVLAIMTVPMNRLFVQSARTHRTMMDSVTCSQNQRADMETALALLAAPDWEETLSDDEDKGSEEMSSDSSAEHFQHELSSAVQIIPLWEGVPIVLVTAVRPEDAPGSGKDLRTIRYPGNPPWTLESRSMVTSS